MRQTFLLLLMLIYFNLSYSETEVFKYFENTDYELNVYHIKGKEPGKTLMIIGGIQGDESGGYLSADLYVDTILEKGNLIIVPRANVPTIVQNKRQITKDMNRRFDEPKTNIFEDQVVEILKELMHKSDILLNLHEGGGYYRETYIDKMHNPMKFGQCIIADTDSFYVEKKAQTIKLGDIARTICLAVNPKISDEKYHFRFNNHNTVSSTTKHLEQRKSATYYGLTQAGIPSFGIEVSKQLPSLEMKIRHHTLVLNAFLQYLDIVPEYPGIFLDKPDYEFVVFNVNGINKMVEKGQALYIDQPSDIKVSFIKGNYQRGYLLDIDRFGTSNDMNKTFFVDQNSQLIIRKDNVTIDKIPILLEKQPESYKGLKLLVDNTEYQLSVNENLDIDQNSQIQIIGALNDNDLYEINFLGYANPKNSADDKGYLISINDKLIKKFSPDNGKSWLIEVLQNKRKIASHRLFVKEMPTDSISKTITQLKPDLKPFQLLFTLNGKDYQIYEGDTLVCHNGDKLSLNKVIPDKDTKDKLNAKDQQMIKINLAGFIADPKKDGDDKGKTFSIDTTKFYKKFQLEENLYEIQINLYEKRLSLFYLKILE
ncbi:MAG TPA: M14/M99 family metallopeptidase [Candidatus Cloacimonadota bacterium]|nr:M14/M99 family metallopeptidase [Candidatus Cloacimonadota bacterium]HPM00697.1 M14/M99 family metallopeptidase [Candidatus Cloacimonadota bacterium]